MNVVTLLTQSVERYPEHTALVFEQRRWSYAQWYARIRRFAAALSALGVRPSDRVALFLHTSEPCATAYFACQLLGAVAVPMNFRLAPAEAAYILNDSGARVVIYSEALAATVQAAAERATGVHSWVGAADQADALPGGHHHYETLAERPAEDRAWPETAPDALSALVYTSGTTGRPKGVMHTHANDVAIAMNCVMEYRMSQRDVALHIAPLYHVGGMQAYFLPHLLVGGTNVILPRYEALATLQAIEREGITTLFAVPTQIQELLFHPDFARTDVSSLRMITTGGAAIAAAVMERVIREFCPSIYNGYGMTEASLTLLLQPEDGLAHLGSCGKPTLISQCRIVRHDGEHQTACDDTVADGEIGQLIVRGPQMTPGYWDKPEESRRKIHDGWLYTGDLLSRDAQGYYHFHGRVDDMIVSGGENIYPREVEEVLYRCPGVKEAAVVGLPDAKWGNVVTAFVVRATPDITADDIDVYCKTSGELAAFKRPKRIVFLDSLPINPSGKVLRRELIAAHASYPQETTA